MSYTWDTLQHLLWALPVSPYNTCNKELDLSHLTTPVTMCSSCLTLQHLLQWALTVSHYTCNKALPVSHYTCNNELYLSHHTTLETMSSCNNKLYLSDLTTPVPMSSTCLTLQHLLQWALTVSHYTCNKALPVSHYTCNNELYLSHRTTPVLTWKTSSTLSMATPMNLALTSNTPGSSVAAISNRTFLNLKAQRMCPQTL